MNTIIKRLGPVKLTARWFSREKPKSHEQLTVYKQCTSLEPVTGFHRQAFATKLIDLDRGPEEFATGFDRDTAYDVRRAERDGIVFGIEQNREEGIRFYNAFANSKGRNAIGGGLSAYGEVLEITKAVHLKNTLVMHFFLVDPVAGRARMLYSASQFRDVNSPAQRQLIGRANRFLHLQDMLHYRGHGLAQIDLGGYATENVSPDLQRINKFKDGFGGRLVEESDYVPLWLYHFGNLRGAAKE